MSRESKDYLQSLRNGRDKQGPQVNWTRGFNGENDEHNDSTNNQNQRTGWTDNTSTSRTPSWDENADDGGWW